MAKTIVCHCEDVTLKDLEDAFESGYRDLESLKRYTGFATGFCQGKSCIAHTARFLGSLKGGDDVVSDPPRTRPLLHPTPVGRFAGIEHASDARANDPEGAEQSPPEETP